MRSESTFLTLWFIVLSIWGARKSLSAVISKDPHWGGQLPEGPHWGGQLPLAPGSPARCLLLARNGADPPDKQGPGGAISASASRSRITFSGGRQLPCGKTLRAAFAEVFVASVEPSCPRPLASSTVTPQGTAALASGSARRSWGALSQTAQRRRPEAAPTEDEMNRYYFKLPHSGAMCYAARATSVSLFMKEITAAV